MRDLLDAAVWLALSAPDHAHYPRARRYWDDEAAGELAFCRATELGFLRQLTNPRVLGNRALDAGAAWRALQSWRALPQITWLAEPPGVDELLAPWARQLDCRSGDWTAAYLAAFAAASGSRLVAFDPVYQRFQGIDFLHLTA